MKYWLLKSEPHAFSIDDLKKRPHQTEPWDGVRNYLARNFLRDQIKKGDLAFFYHSNAKPSGIAGIVTIVKAGYPDDTAFDPVSKYFDEKSNPKSPRWFRVDVKFKEKFLRIITLAELKQIGALKKMALFTQSRLSVQPVTSQEWQVIIKCANDDKKRQKLC